MMQQHVQPLLPHIVRITCVHMRTFHTFIHAYTNMHAGIYISHFHTCKHTHTYIRIRTDYEIHGTTFTPKESTKEREREAEGRERRDEPMDENTKSRLTERDSLTQGSLYTVLGFGSMFSLSSYACKKNKKLVSPQATSSCIHSFWGS